MTKNDFRKLVSSHGGTCRYSGKDRTFYVHPDGLIDTTKDLTRHKRNWLVKKVETEVAP